MNAGNTSGMRTRFRQVANQGCCPECSDKMTEVDQCNENEALSV